MQIAGGTAKRITKRIINFILVIWGVVTLSFCLQVFTGTDPAEMIVRKVNVFATEEQIQAVREELGLDAPFLERYTDYIKGVSDRRPWNRNHKPSAGHRKYQRCPPCDLYAGSYGNGLGHHLHGIDCRHLCHTKRRDFR